MVNLWAFARIPVTMIDTLSFCLDIMVKQKPGSVGGYEVVQTKDGFTLCEAEQSAIRSSLTCSQDCLLILQLQLINCFYL